MNEISRYTGGSTDVIVGGNLEAFKAWSQTISTSGILPKGLVGKPADILVTVLHGLDLGIKPMQAFQMVNVVNGRPSLSSEGMRALILRDGHEFEILEATALLAKVRGRRRGMETWNEAEFSLEDAKTAKLSGDNWTKYPSDMLLARATSRLARRFFGDVIGGLVSTEEALDEAPTPPRRAPQDASPPVEPVSDEDVRTALQALEAAHVDGELVEDVDADPTTGEVWPTAATPGGDS